MQEMYQRLTIGVEDEICLNEFMYIGEFIRALKLTGANEYDVYVKLNKSRFVSGIVIRNSILPDEIKNFMQLEELTYINGKTKEFPEFIFDITTLKSLNLANNNFEVIPEDIAKLEKIEQLYLRGNQLMKIPILNMTSLTVLSIDNNNFSEFPDLRGNIRLTHLYIDNNQIAKLPSYLSTFNYLERFDLDINLLDQHENLINLLITKNCSIYQNDGQRIIYKEGMSLKQKLINGDFDKFIDGKSISTLNLYYLQEFDWDFILKFNYKYKELIIPFNLFSKIPENICYLNQIEEISFFFAGSGKIVNKFIEELPSEFGNLNKLTDLDLSGLRIKTLPESFGNLINLDTLKFRDEFEDFPDSHNLTSNQLKSLPKSFGSLIKLQELYLTRMNFTTLPNSFGKLKIKKLVISACKFIQIPSCICDLEELEYLEINGEYENQMTEVQIISLPENIGKLKKLKVLKLPLLNLNKLPDSISELVSLEVLDISNNLIKRLPENFGNLTRLRKLDISYNQITELPESISDLTNLEDFWLEYVDGDNCLDFLPESIGNLKKLRILGLNSIALKSLPESITELTGLQKLYLKNQDCDKLLQNIKFKHPLEIMCDKKN